MNTPLLPPNQADQASLTRDGVLPMFRGRSRIGSFVPSGLALALIATVTEVSLHGRTPLPAQEPNVRTYRFKARVTDNDGVAPFKVGELITGTFTYDLKGSKVAEISSDVVARYKSRLNSIVFRFGDLRFVGKGEIHLNIAMLEQVENVGIIAPDLELPKGWAMDHTGPSQTYSFTVGNAPPRKVVRSIAIPDRISLSDYPDFREVSLDFYNGVRFPGGEVNKRAVVSANVESLE